MLLGWLWTLPGHPERLQQWKPSLWKCYWPRSHRLHQCCPSTCAGKGKRLKDCQKGQKSISNIYFILPKRWHTFRIIYTLAREKHNSHFLCYKKSCAGERWHEHPEHPCLVRHASKSEPLWPKFAFSSKSTSQSKTLGNLFDSTLPSQWEDSRLRWAATNYENVSKVRKNASSFKRLEKNTTLWTF